VKAVLATANPDKAREIRDVLREAGVTLDLVPRPSDVPEIEETGATLEDNARLKALALCDATGLLAVADDTGLEVDALHGAPGVHSARYAGDDVTYADNVRKLLDELRGVPGPARTARFVTVAVACWPDGHEVVARGEVDGLITDVPRGREGFGYDPVFAPIDGDGRTFAEMTPNEKHEVSHRGRAFRSLARALAVRGDRERSGMVGDRPPE
jgi:XTP/dITP diphosphohydrolase